jgi:hypothetical protein
VLLKHASNFVIAADIAEDNSKGGGKPGHIRRTGWRATGAEAKEIASNVELFESLIAWLHLRPSARALPPPAKKRLLSTDNTNSALLSAILVRDA